MIFENEKRGIQEKTGTIIRRYYAHDFDFSDYKQRTIHQNSGYNNDDGFGRGDSEKTSGTDEQVEKSEI